MLLEEGSQTGLARALGVLERRPAGEEIAEHQRVFVLEPLERLRKVLLEGGTDAIGETAHVLDQRTTLLDEQLERSHRGAVRMQLG